MSLLILRPWLSFPVTLRRSLDFVREQYVRHGVPPLPNWL
jgi:hypothetical protein